MKDTPTKFWKKMFVTFIVLAFAGLITGMIFGYMLRGITTYGCLL